jgi:hypothetical protein
VQYLSSIRHPFSFAGWMDGINIRKKKDNSPTPKKEKGHFTRG